MLELFGFAWVTITFTCCVAAVSTRRSVLRWLKARTDRKRLDDTVEIVRRPLRRLATYAALVVLAVPAGVYAGGGALPGPSGGFGGGTVGSAMVLTGDNSGGTGTLRIRPSDEDAQLVLCEASNNAATEVCSALQHYNASATVAGFNFTANGYVDSGFTQQRNNTAFGSVVLNGSVSSTAASNFILMNAYGTGGAAAGNAGLAVTGASASTFITGSVGTVTNDFRGPILNGGSATCNGSDTGEICLNDLTAVNSAHALFTYGLSVTNSTSNASEGLSITATGGGSTTLGCYGASTGDSDYDSRCGLFAPASTGFYFYGTTNVAAGTNMLVVMDNTSATGATLFTVDGDGNTFLNTAATRTKGTITLVAGTGTATVSSGCTPACSDTTAVNAVKCVVSGTTLTATGTGTDVISYLCF